MGSQRTPPPPPAIPPPPADISNDASSVANSHVSDPKAKASSAVMDAGGITRGLLSSSPAAMNAHMPMRQIAEESSPEKMMRIDISDAERRRRIAAGCDDADGGSDRGIGRRTYEEDNAGYGQQMLSLATSCHHPTVLPMSAIPPPTSATSAALAPAPADDGKGAPAGDGGKSGREDGASGRAAAAAAAASGGGPGAASVSASTSAAGRRAEAAARLRALRGVGTGEAAPNGTDSGVVGTSHPSRKSRNISPPAPPPVAPPSTAAASTSKDMAAKIQRLNDDRGKGTTGAQQRAAELGELGFCRCLHIYIYIYIVYMDDRMKFVCLFSFGCSINSTR